MLPIRQTHSLYIHVTESDRIQQTSDLSVSLFLTTLLGAWTFSFSASTLNTINHVVLKSAQLLIFTPYYSLPVII